MVFLFLTVKFIIIIIIINIILVFVYDIVVVVVVVIGSVVILLVITPRRKIIRLLGMYALEPIVIGCGSMFVIGFCMAFVFSLLDRHTRGICTGNV